jgi:hypothetical protein
VGRVPRRYKLLNIWAKGRTNYRTGSPYADAEVARVSPNGLTGGDPGRAAAANAEGLRQTPKVHRIGVDAL